MIVGCLGDIVFSVSSNEVNTISNVKWTSTAKYAELDRHLNDPLLEFTGNDADEFTFSMYFSTFLGVNPMGQIVKLLNAKREGRVMPLVIGAKAYGTHKWVIT
ncbi:MAG: phage tail protein, partial [Oscillospiraceae bacterium]